MQQMILFIYYACVSVCVCVCVCVDVCTDNSVIVSWDSKQSIILTLVVKFLNIFTRWHLPCAVSNCTSKP